MDKPEGTWKGKGRAWLEDARTVLLWWAIIVLLVLFSGAPSKFIYIDF